MPRYEIYEPTITELIEDQSRCQPDDPVAIADNLEHAAKGLEWAMLTSGGLELQRLYAVAKRIGEIAEHGHRLAELD